MRQDLRLVNRAYYIVAFPVIFFIAITCSCTVGLSAQYLTWEFYSFEGIQLSTGDSLRGFEENEELPWLASTVGTSGVVRIMRNGVLMESREYKDGVLDGDFIIWQSSSRMLAKSTYISGALHGVTLIWHEDGPLMSIAEYAGGEKHGSYKEWHRNGIKRAQAEYEDGRKHGLSQSWNVQGRIVENAEWREGHPWNGIIVDYHRVGESPVMAVYSEGERQVR